MGKLDFIRKSLSALAKTEPALSEADRNKILRALIVLIQDSNFSESELYKYLDSKFDFEPNLEKSLVNMAVKYAKDPASKDYLFQSKVNEGKGTPVEESKVVNLLMAIRNDFKELRDKNFLEQKQILTKIDKEITVLDGVIQNMIFTIQEQGHIELI